MEDNIVPNLFSVLSNLNPFSGATAPATIPTTANTDSHDQKAVTPSVAPASQQGGAFNPLRELLNTLSNYESTLSQAHARLGVSADKILTLQKMSPRNAKNHGFFDKVETAIASIPDHTTMSAVNLAKPDQKKVEQPVPALKTTAAVGKVVSKEDIAQAAKHSHDLIEIALAETQSTFEKIYKIESAARNNSLSSKSLVELYELNQEVITRFSDLLNEVQMKIDIWRASEAFLLHVMDAVKLGDITKDFADRWLAKHLSTVKIKLETVIRKVQRDVQRVEEIVPYPSTPYNSTLTMPVVDSIDDGLDLTGEHEATLHR